MLVLVSCFASATKYLTLSIFNVVYISIKLTAKKRPCFPLRRPVLEAEPMPRARSSSSLPKLSSVEPKTIDIISMADHKMNCLSQEVTRLQADLLLQTDTIETLKRKVY